MYAAFAFSCRFTESAVTVLSVCSGSLSDGRAASDILSSAFADTADNPEFRPDIFVKAFVETPGRRNDIPRMIPNNFFILLVSLFPRGLYAKRVF